MIQKILLAVDGSDHAAKAAAFCGDLASRYDADVVLLHVLDPRQFTPEHQRMAEVEHILPAGHGQLPWVENVPAELAAMLQEDTTSEGRSRVLGYLADKVVGDTTRVLRKHGLDDGRLRCLLKNGNPVSGILETASDEQADLIVMGSRGLSSLRGLAQGSVSQKVSHLADCTVLTVK